MACSALLRGLAAFGHSALFAVLLFLPPAARAADPGIITAAQPTLLETEEGGVHGQLAVAPEVVSADTRVDLVYRSEEHTSELQSH